MSEDGLLVSLRQPLPVGSHVSVIVRPPGAPSMGLRGEVVRVTPASTSPDVRYDVGIRLVGENDGLRRIVTPADGRAARGG